MSARLPLALWLFAALPAAAEEPRRLDLRELLAIASRSTYGSTLTMASMSNSGDGYSGCAGSTPFSIKPSMAATIIDGLPPVTS